MNTKNTMVTGDTKIKSRTTMSKISEQKALEAYPICNCYNEQCMMQEDVNIELRTGYEEGYDQAMKDIQEQAEKSVIEKSNGEVTIEDLVAYNQGFKTGRNLTMQDFLEKACEWLSKQPMSRPVFWTVEDFKNYMQNESEN